MTLVLGIIFVLLITISIFKYMWWDEIRYQGWWGFKNFWEGFTTNALLLAASFFISILCGAIVLASSCGLGMGMHYWLGTKTTIPKVVNIVSAKNKEGVEGHVNSGFLVASVYVESKEFYLMFQELPDGSYTRFKTKAEETIVHEYEKLENEKPRVEYNNKKTTSIWIWPSKETVEAVAPYHLYIPKGSINKEFKLQ